MEEKNIWVVGGDRRQVYLAGLLREDGHTLHTVGLGEKERGLDDLALAHCVILPLPVLGKNGRIHTPLSQEKIDLSQVLDHMRPGQVLCGGMVSPEVREAGEGAGF